MTYTFRRMRRSQTAVLFPYTTLFRSNGASTDTLLTAGTVEVTGDFSENSGAAANAFAASGTHKVLMNGSSEEKTSYLSTPEDIGSRLSHIQNQEIANTNVGVSFTSNA